MISCVCLTIPGRTEFLKRAIDSFQRQKFEDRELVIVADGYEEFVPVRPLLNDLDIRLQRVKAGAVSVGQKRNIGCAHARGETIALWDDDDYSAPHRLTEQYALLEASGKAVTALYRIYLTNADQSAWWLSHPGWIDTSLMFKKSWWEGHEFTDKMIGQDGDFMHEANRRGQFHLGGEPRWMFATNHPGNTCERSAMYSADNALNNFTWTDK